MKNLISVSVMCSDLMALGQDIKELERLGVDWLHVDIMDGHFVPNLTFGPDFVKAMHRTTDLPLDIHLMVEDPGFFMGLCDLREGDTVTAHVELGQHFEKLSAGAHAAGCRFGVALNPETPVDALEPHIHIMDAVTVMLVRPGHAGSKMVEGIMDKVGEVRSWLDAHGRKDVLISVDGSVSAERAHYMAGLGASIFVGGTAGIYRKGMSLEDTIPAFREAITL